MMIEQAEMREVEEEVGSRLRCDSSWSTDRIPCAAISNDLIFCGHLGKLCIIMDLMVEMTFVVVVGQGQRTNDNIVDGLQQRTANGWVDSCAYNGHKAQTQTGRDAFLQLE